MTKAWSDVSRQEKGRQENGKEGIEAENYRRWR